MPRSPTCRSRGTVELYYLVVYVEAMTEPNRGAPGGTKRMSADVSDAARSDAIAKDWEKAVSYSITDEDIERARLLVGVDLAMKHREYIQTATTDNIRNFAH